MKRVIEDIKTGEWKQIYLFTGSEDYLKLQYRDKLIQALMPEGDTMNLSRFQGKGTGCPGNYKSGRDDALFCRAPDDRAGGYRFF